MVSLKDIAAACGVSTATVSKALNDLPDISNERKQYIREKAKEMGYLPNLAARALKTNHSYNIGILFVDDKNSGLTHPHFSKVLESLKTEAESRGYDVTFINHQYGKRKTSYLEHCRYRGVDGVVIACVDFNQPEVLELINSNIPTVTIDHVFSGSAAILSDNAQGMRQLMEYILSQGHRQIAYIHGKDSAVTRERTVSFYRILEEHGIEVPDEYVREGIYNDPKEAAEQTRRLLELKNPPTCILYPDDYASMGGLAALKEAGLSVPEDISIAGFDGISIAEILEPPLTTLGQDTESIGRMAAAKLIDLIEKPKTTNQDIEKVAGTLITGRTVRKL
ncbi:MAG: LacI family DNA-binding transcriptional regulator [Candidatus Limivivens sp.]|nr:LacI family DNA-binding transcriptional regulator [Candidatus Limivivens sp.]